MKRYLRTRRRPGPVRICHVTTTDQSIAGLYRGQHRYFVQQGYEVWGTASVESRQAAQAEAEGLRFYPVVMSRSFGVVKDCFALFRLFRFFRNQQFDVVEAGTLKGGFLGMIAAWMAGVPLRIYTLRGASYVTSKGVVRWVIVNMVRWSCRAAHLVIAVGYDIKKLCDDDRLCPKKKTRVILLGSSNGVSLERFTRNQENEIAARKLRARAGIPANAIVVGIVARLKREKGICELVEAFRCLAESCPALHLLVVGDRETMLDPLPDETDAFMRSHERIHEVGFQDNTPRYYAAMDIFALPSYREGFANTLLEASAMELPVITTDAIGCREAVLHGVTGLIVPIADPNALTEALERLICEESLRQEMACHGRVRIEKHYDQKKYWPALDALYREMLSARNLPLPESPKAPVTLDSPIPITPA